MEEGGYGQLFLSTIWVGQSWQTASYAGKRTSSTQSLVWCLSLTPSTEYPSAFGATQSNPPRVLHGRWTPTTSSVQLVSQQIDTPLRTYEGTLRREEDGSVTIQGSYAETATGSHGFFCVCAEPENESEHISGLWIGQAVPDESLAPFMIPTNPIRWSLAILKSNNEGDDESLPTIFGSGYFDDAADIPGQPLLFYTLQGTQEGGGKLKLIKKYDAIETQSYTVTYEGELKKSEGEEGIVWDFSGEWNNPEGGSFGQFRCFREAVGGFNVHSTFCAVCQRKIRPGETQFVAVDILDSWRCCVTCKEGGHGQGRSLEEEIVLTSEAAQGGCCAALAADALQRFSSRPFLSTRRHNTASTTSTTTGFTWLTYGDVAPCVKHLAVGIVKALGWDYTSRDRPTYVLIDDLSPAYVAALLGGLVAGCVLVPLHGALEPGPLASCLSLVQPAAVLVGKNFLEKTQKAISLSGVKPSLTVVLQHGGLPSSSSTSSSPIMKADEAFTLDLDGLAAIGYNASIEGGAPSMVVMRSPEDVTAILFTSGSSGEPKGVAYTERLLKPSEGASNVLPLVKLDIQPFHPSFIVSLLSIMQVGGRRAICTDLGTVLEDAKIARPTHISAPPIFWTMLQREHSSRMSAAMATNNSADADKRKTNQQLLEEVSKEIRLLLGNRLVAVATGGAALSPTTLQFVREKLGLDLADLYGSRETGGIAKDGIIYPGVDVKLLEVPDMGYSPSSHPPRGEIAVNSNRLFSGYFKNDKATSSAFIEIGGKPYYRTGDIGELSGGKLRVIDRCGSVVKLAHSEWLSPTRVEIVLESSPLVSQAFVMGLPGYRYPVAIIVPSDMLGLRMANEKDRSPESVLLKELRYWCIHHHLRPFEVPQAVAIENTPWTPHNGFLTSTLKKRRGPLTAHYKSICDGLYATMEENKKTEETEKEEMDRLSPQFEELLSRVLDVSHVDPSATLSEVGADSMSSARLAWLLSEEGVPVNPRTVHTYSLAHLDAMLNQAQSGDYVPAPIDSTLSVDWIAEQTLPTSLPPMRIIAEKDRDILITGGTGFLGPYLVNSVLRDFPSRKGRVFVLVRGNSDEEAYKRLQGDMMKAKLWDDNSTTIERLKVIAGDLSKEHFGLKGEVWDALIEGVGDIFHSGAKVDVTLPYTALKKINVAGTLTVIELALRAGARVHYISSASATPTTTQHHHHSKKEGEEEEGWKELGGRMDGDELSLKGGYAATKVVSERLLYEAWRSHNMDVRIFRPSAICGDASGDRPWNEFDFSFMLLRAIASMGVLPSPAPMQLHWVPVDWVAHSIVTLSSTPTPIRVFNLCGDAPTIEDVVQELSKTHPIKRIPPTEWVAAIESHLMKNNDDDGSNSSRGRLGVLMEDLKKLDWSGNGGESAHSIPTAITRKVLKECCNIEWYTIGNQHIAACAKLIMMEK